MKRLFFTLILFISCAVGFAQATDSVKVFRIGIFANLFLDSSFDSDNYKFKNQMPKHILPGLDFVEGALMGVDSFYTNHTVRVSVYDIRSKQQSINELYNQHAFDSMDLIIGSVTGNEYRLLADIAKYKQIPFISGTYPNDAGVTNNQYTIIINSTLSVHCEAIYNYIMRSSPTANILLVSKPGQMEDRLLSYFNSHNKTTSGKQLLKWKTVSLSDSFTADELAPHLDSTNTNLIICTSIDERFGLNLAIQANSLLSNFELQLMGMPTWDAIKDLSKNDFNNLSVYYSTAFFNTGSPQINHFTRKFQDQTNGRPSDLAYRGYELTYNFINLLLKFDKNLMQHLNDKTFHTFTNFEFRPVINPTTGLIDYYENNKIYILKQSKGMLSRMD